MALDPLARRTVSSIDASGLSDSGPLVGGLDARRPPSISRRGAARFILSWTSNGCTVSLGDFWEMIMKERPGATRGNAHRARGSEPSSLGFQGLAGSRPVKLNLETAIYTIFEGTSEIQRMVISRALAK
ncbi:hypothetical protein CP979_05015 [Streptomyces filamentosus]|nr:hypothetical protein CP979_05015 [Streptomyces filamentosus]